jgi:hypothetical protein
MTASTTAIGVLSQKEPEPPAAAAEAARLDREQADAEAEAELSAALRWCSNARRNSMRLRHSAIVAWRGDRGDGW